MDHDHTIHQMIQIILGDILESVVQEFEATTDAEIGAIHIGPKNGATAGRRIEVDIQNAGSNAISGLLQYQQILCAHDGFAHSRYCRTEHPEKTT